MTLFTRLPISVPGASLGRVARGDIEFFTDYEPDADEHWMFQGGTSAVLTGKVAGGVLTPQNAAPTYASDSLSTPTVAGNALLSPYGEIAAQVDTIFTVFKTVATASGLEVLFGTLPPATDATGGSPFLSGASPARKLFLTYRGVVSSGDSSLTVAKDAWHFLSLARDFSGTTKTIRGNLDGHAFSFTAPSAYVPAPSPRKIALGNAYYGSSTVVVQTSYAEFGIFDQALSADDLQALYTRRKAKMADRSIVVT